MRYMIYKCEPMKCVPLESGVIEPDLEYCAGERDFENMRIAVIGTWASWKLPGRRLEAFTLVQKELFQNLVDKAEIIIGFNSLCFDDNLIQANGIRIETNHDLLREILGEVLFPSFKTEFKRNINYEDLLARYPIVAKYSLAAFVQANLGKPLSGNSQSASILWQRQQGQNAIDDCLRKVLLIKKLYELYRRDRLFDPIYGRPVSRKFPIPVPTQSVYQKLVALGLGAYFQRNGNYAYLRRFADYEHYAFLCSRS